MNQMIKKTTNYNMFEPHEMNREIKEDSTEFKELLESMKKYGFIDDYPIVCVANGGRRLKIKAGHNRFRAAQLAGVPVYYKVSRCDVPIHELEKGPGKWTTMDYVESYAKRGYPDYEEVVAYIQETGISLKNALSMFIGHSAGSRNYEKNARVQKGEYKILNREHPRIVGDIVKFLQHIGIQWSVNNGVVTAISRSAWVKEFDPERFKERVAAHKYLFEKQKDRAAYMDMLEFIYNYRLPNRKKIKLARLAEDEAEKRWAHIRQKAPVE